MARARTIDRTLTVLALAGMAVLPAGCAAFGAKDPSIPQWFKDRTEQLEDEPFPRLAQVPEPPEAGRSQEAWNRIETELRAAEAALAASPRAEPASESAEAQAAFEADARAAAEPDRPPR